MRSFSIRFCPQRDDHSVRVECSLWKVDNAQRDWNVFFGWCGNRQPQQWRHVRWVRTAAFIDVVRCAASSHWWVQHFLVPSLPKHLFLSLPLPLFFLNTCISDCFYVFVRETEKKKFMDQCHERDTLLMNWIHPGFRNSNEFQSINLKANAWKNTAQKSSCAHLMLTHGMWLYRFYNKTVNV